MKIVDMTDEHRELYFVCLEDWSDEMKDAGGKKLLRQRHYLEDFSW